MREKIARGIGKVFYGFWKPHTTSSPSIHAESVRGNPKGWVFVNDVVSGLGGWRDGPEDHESRAVIVRRAKTVLRWVADMFRDGDSHAILPYIPELLPVLVGLPELSPEDEELEAFTRLATGYLSTVSLVNDLVEPIFAAVIKACGDPSWHARRRALLVLQVITFQNLFLAPRAATIDCLVTLLSDDQLEVRLLASESLSGMIRCTLVDDHLALIPKFVSMARTKIRPKKRQRLSTNDKVTALSASEKQALVTRHAGVLGLQACVLASPYSIPEWMPETLVIICLCSGDPEPIAGSVRKTVGDFWRTHQEDRAALASAFNEDQLSAVQDLVLGHNYYA